MSRSGRRIGPVTDQVYESARPAGFYPWQPKESSLELVNAAIDVINELSEYWPLTDRQIMYRLLDRRPEPKDKLNDDLQRVLDLARRSRMISMEVIRDDNLVVMREEPGWRSIDQFRATIDGTVQGAVNEFRRDPWASQEVRLEVWCEAAGMVPQIQRMVRRGIAVVSSSGFDSISAKYQRAKIYSKRAVPTRLGFIGDLDRHGLATMDSRAAGIEAFLADLNPEMTVDFDRIAVTPDQITTLDLPHKPGQAKQRPAAASNRRGQVMPGDYDGPTVQAEAIDPADLENLLNEWIERHVDREAWNEAKEQGELERASLTYSLTWHEAEST